MGRAPMPVDEELCDFICDCYATSSASLKTILEKHAELFPDKITPSPATIFKWLDENPSFAENYTRAKDAQAEYLAEAVPEIANDGRNDWMERLAFDGANKGWEINGEAVARSRVRIDAYKWMAGRLKPKKYGDKLAVDQTMSVSPDLAGLMERIGSVGKRLNAPEETAPED